jgi:glutathione reductase (NADPH)
VRRQAFLEAYIDAAEKRARFLREAAQLHWSSTDALSRKSKTRCRDSEVAACALGLSAGAGLGGRLPMRVRGQCDQRTHFGRPHRMDRMPDLSDTNALQGPPGVSRPAAEASAPSREAEFDVDLFVIGGGSGGVRAARVASGHGAKVLLAEEYRLGGTCVIRGCVPKKLFVYASRFSDAFDQAAEFGWRLSVPHFDWPSLVAAKDREITRLEGLYCTDQVSAGVEVVRSRAVLEDAQTVRLLKDGRRIRARTILIATGARPELPPFDGIELGITSDDVFDLKTFPRNLVIGGAGYIAMEFAGLFAALGSDVTVVCRGSNVLRGFDEDVRRAIAAS